MEGRIMKSTTSHLPASMPRTFDGLNALHPLRPIKDHIDLENAEEVMDRLAVLNKRTKDQNDYLETLILLTEAYEADEIADAMDLSKSAGLDALKYIMQSQGMKQAELGRLLGVGASAASMILSGARPITADHARKLGKRFGMRAGAFI
jgi:antitoxin component HigA of HigAB toxin-antitoxin module